MNKLLFLVSFLVFGLGFGQNLNPSDIDPTFNTYNIPFGNYYVDGYVSKVCVQSDNKIIFLVNNKLIRTNNNVLDSGFNSGSGFYSGATGGLIIYDMELLSNGEIIVTGNFSSYNGQNVNKIIKINSDGSLNTSFSTSVSNFTLCSTCISLITPIGNDLLVQGSDMKLYKLNSNGIVDSSFYSFTFDNIIRSIKIQTDGKILVGGDFVTFNGLASNRLVRLNSNGTIDSTFNIGTGFNNSVHQIETQSDGKIIVGGLFTNYNTIPKNHLIRLNVDGSIDTTLNSGSGFVSNIATNPNEFVIQKIKVCPDDKILIFGTFFKYKNQSVGRIVKLENNGNKDTTYYLFAMYSGQIYDIADFSDGSSILVGDFTTFNFELANNIVKITENGIRDISYNNLHLPGFRGVSDATLQSDGKILVANSGSYNNNSSGLFCRLNTDGTIDTTFIGNNISPSASFIYKKSVIPQTDGKILILLNNGTLKRYNYDGSVDTSFQQVEGVYESSIQLLPNGKIIVGGLFQSVNGIERNGLAVLNSNGTLDTSFPNIGFLLASTATGTKQVLVQPDGKIIVTGLFNKVNGNFTYKKAVRLNQDGTIDNTFVLDNAIASLSSEPYFQLFSNGKIMAYIVPQFPSALNHFTRLNENGSIDTSFNFDANSLGYRSFKILANDKILITKSVNNLPASPIKIIRVNYDGSIDENFESQEIDGSFYNVEGSKASVKSIIEQQDGKIVLSGDFKNYNNVNKFGIVRLMGEDYNFINGQNKFDDENDGCTIDDFSFPNMKLKVENGTNVFDYISDVSGNYKIANADGNFTITPTLENPSYFTASPPSIQVNFPSQPSPVIQDFCITPNGVHPDLEITLLPLTVARPGFESKYRLVYKNKGNQLQSGTVNFNFNDAVLNFASATTAVSSQTLNNLNWNFTNLLPLETREITITLNVNSPTAIPPVNSGFVLNYTTSVSSTVTDEMPNDNTFVFNHTVVNSFDPNDKTCLEGATIAATKVGDYVHYMIRFENTGSYHAQNITVKDVIDTTKYDINTLITTSGSHSFITRVLDGNRIEFYFENINLPFADATNDGYVAFKIKTKSTLVAGDSFSNTASIYFDYNYPIITNTATTSVAALSNQDFTFNDYFSVYPNPVSNDLNISKKEAIEISSITIYNMLGQIVIAIPNAKNVESVDVSTLKSGNYFVKINSDKGTSNTKFVKM